MRDAECQHPKTGLASLCCRFAVHSFHLNAFIERVYNIVGAIAKDWVQ